MRYMSVAKLIKTASRLQERSDIDLLITHFWKDVNNIKLQSNSKHLIED